jgi:monooxygenase
MTNHQDVLIVGAGFSGICAAYYLQLKCPNLSFSILEERSSIGGTWDLFRYPGIRSDSDMYTLGFAFRPWMQGQALASGEKILEYIKESAAATGVADKIRYRHKVLEANWSSSEKKWSVTVLKVESGEKINLTCRFLFMCSGYYNFAHGNEPLFKGQENFQGKFIHPQKWPVAFDYSDKRIVVIGSGATAVTLVPQLAKKAREVVLLQRSPTYVVNLPSQDFLASFLKKVGSAKLAHHLIRWRNILISMAFYQFCIRLPKLAKSFIEAPIRRSFPKQLKHFQPKYDPWKQRVCFVPDNDLFLALENGKARMVTNTIESITNDGILLSSGEELKADIIVTATGLELKFLAGTKFSIDGKELELSKVYPYKGSMLSGVPNFAMALGYTNASWTLKCDLICNWVAELLRHMERNEYSVVVPKENPKLQAVPLFDFSSGYLVRAKDKLPRQGLKSPWKVHQNYFLDLIDYRCRPVADRDLTFF